MNKPHKAAPHVYRPQNVPKVLQKKPVAIASPAFSGPQRQMPVAPPVYRPAPKKIVQPKAATIAQSRLAQASPAARPAPRTPSVLQRKPPLVQNNLAQTGKPKSVAATGVVRSAPHAPRPHIVQRQLASRVVQRLTDVEELRELDAFYLREIREIGSPTARRHREMYALAKQDATLPAAKNRIRDYITAWKQNLERESREPSPGPSLRSPTAGMTPISSSDLSSVLGPHRPRPTSLNQKQKLHFTYGRYKALPLEDRLYHVAEMASDFGVTLFELQKRANTMMLQQLGVLDHIDELARRVRANRLDPDDITRSRGLSLDGLVGVYYRYHKFAGDPDSRQFVFGGFFNKSEITNSEQTKGIKNYFKNRHEALETLSTGTPLDQALALEAAQANARSTPFIATTSNRGYARQLFGEYPPSEEQGQRAAIVTIIGPSCNTLDFEREFARLDAGFRLFNLRTVNKRSKDREQFEFGIPDIFIPVAGRSPFGFVIANIEWL